MRNVASQTLLMQYTYKLTGHTHVPTTNDRELDMRVWMYLEDTESVMSCLGDAIIILRQATTLDELSDCNYVVDHTAKSSIQIDTFFWLLSVIADCRGSVCGIVESR